MRACRVHCALVPRAEGLLLVDLLGKGGTRVDHKRIRWAYVQAGSVLTIGRYEMSVWHRKYPSLWDENSPAANAATRTPTPPDDAFLRLPTQEPQQDEVEAESEASSVPDPTIEEAPVLKSEDTGLNLDERDTAAPSESPPEWLGTLFAIEHQGTTLVVTPTIRDGMFRYAKLRTEASSLRVKLAGPNIRGLVIDLRELDYVGWDAISIVVALARQMESSGGPAALCCPTPQVQQTLTNMGLSRIWPTHPTREAALAAVSSRATGSKVGNR
jgi:anti-anti-sigma factor